MNPHGRAVGLLHDWQGGYVKTVSGYGKRIQHRPIRAQPSPNLHGRCGLIFSALAWSFCVAINVSPHQSLEAMSIIGGLGQQRGS